MVTFLVCLVVVGGAMAAILVVTMGGAAEEPATPRRRTDRKEQLRALSSRAGAYLVPAGGPATAPLRGPHSRGDLFDDGGSRDARDGGAGPLPERDDAEEAAPALAGATRGAPAEDLPAEEHHPRVEGAAPALATPSGGTALRAPTTALEPAPDPEARPQVGADLTTAPVLVPAPGPTADPAPTAPVPLAAGAAPERAGGEVDLAWSSADRRSSRAGREPILLASRVRRALRRLRGTLVLIVLLIGLGTVLALILVGIAALAALGIRAALSA